MEPEATLKPDLAALGWTGSGEWLGARDLQSIDALIGQAAALLITDGEYGGNTARGQALRQTAAVLRTFRALLGEE